MKQVWNILILALGAAFIAAGFNLFLIPLSLLSGGISGISMLIGYFFGGNIGFIYLLLNIPIAIWGYFVLGKRFVGYSAVSILVTTWFMQILPTSGVPSDQLLGAVFGGVLIGIGTGISLRVGGSSGGFDIVGAIFTRNRDFPLGSLLFALNGLVILALGFKENWDLALFSMISIFVTGKIIDIIHIKHVKVTAMIVTSQTDTLLDKLMKLNRGVTIIRTRGGYTHLDREMLMTVTTRYELVELQRIIKETDPKAFVNIVETVAVWGEFRRT
ncbi:YitT family protein [Paenibacillus gansuensis]|uniref:YitT family protein n=1 Tax=Paenibacillus gansuensis TaxID=306542 RepID=A0ABW5PE29_9BACL